MFDFSSSVRVFLFLSPSRSNRFVRSRKRTDARGTRGGRVLTKCWQPVLYDASIDVGYASPPLRCELENDGVRRGSRVRISCRGIWAFFGWERGGGVGSAPECGAVEGLAEVRDGHVVRLREGRGRLDLEVRRLDRERGQTAGVRARDARQQEHRAREERHVNYMGHSRRARESAAPPRHGAGMRRFGRRSAVSLPRRRRIARTAGRSRRALGLGAVESAGGGGALQTSFTDAVAKPNRC